MLHTNQLEQCRTWMTTLYYHCRICCHETKRVRTILFTSTMLASLPGYRQTGRFWMLQAVPGSEDSGESNHVGGHAVGDLIEAFLQRSSRALWQHGC